MRKLFEKLLLLLSKSDKKYLLLLVLFSIFISMIETIGITAIMPFISVASDFSIINSNKYFKFIYELFSFENQISFIIIFGFTLIIFYFIRSLINYYYAYLLVRFTSSRYHLIVYRLFENYLGRSYRDFVESNSSEMTKSIVSEAQRVMSIISALLFMISEFFVVILIYSMMLYINWKITILLTLLLGVNALFMVKMVSGKIKLAGTLRESSQRKFFEIINSAFGNFKLIKLNSKDDLIKNEFKNASYEQMDAMITSGTLTHFPRLFLEAIGFSIVVFVIIYLVYKYQQDISSAMAMISMFILGLYRLMPSANRLLTNYNTIMYSHRSLEIVHNDLIYEVEDLGNDKIEFNKSIEVNSLKFSYIENKTIINSISFLINKGEKIAFVGESGSGKSTLIDLIIGLYRPESGYILIDGKKLDNGNIKSWRKKVGYIPQSIYLFDGTVAQNVAFGDKVNNDVVKESLRQAKILDFLELNHKGINTMVGEGGIKLSGGQKQRIAIARALYSNPDILVLDEATSALDNETEGQIMNEIYNVSFDKTLIIIAHRLSTIEGCEKIYRFKNGSLVNA